MKPLLNPLMQLGVEAHAFNPSIQEAGIGGSLNAKPAWATEQVPGHTVRPCLKTQIGLPWCSTKFHWEMLMQEDEHRELKDMSL